MCRAKLSVHQTRKLEDWSVVNGRRKRSRESEEKGSTLVWDLSRNWIQECFWWFHEIWEEFIPVQFVHPKTPQPRREVWKKGHEEARFRIEPVVATMRMRGLEWIRRATEVKVAYVTKQVGRIRDWIPRWWTWILACVWQSSGPASRQFLYFVRRKHTVAKMRHWLGATKERHTSEADFSELKSSSSHSRRWSITMSMRSLGNRVSIQ